VQVRPKRKPDQYLPLGAIDAAGTRLLAVISDIMGNNFEATRADGERSVWCENITPYGAEELFLGLQHGETGVAADIFDRTGQFRLRQAVDDTQIVRCGCLFVLPLIQTMGWMAIHNNSGRGVKSLLAGEIDEEFRKRHDELLLEIKPFVFRAALEAAIDEGRVDHVRLIKFVRPNDAAFAETHRWVRGNDLGKVELDISPALQNRRLNTAPIRRFLRGNSPLSDIVTFEGMTFDQAKVEVVLEDGHRRTFNVEKLDLGHPFSVEMDDDLTIGVDGDPTRASLISALRSVLATVR